jgi:hypothetical protein
MLHFIDLQSAIMMKVVAVLVKNIKKTFYASYSHGYWCRDILSTDTFNTTTFVKILGCHNNQHNDIQHNDIQHNNIQHNDIKQNNIQHNDIQHNDIKHNDIQHNNILHNKIQHNNIQHNDI